MCWLLHGKAMSLDGLLKVFICLLAGFEGRAIRGGVPVHVSKPPPAGDWAVMLNIGRPDSLPLLSSSSYWSWLSSFSDKARYKILGKYNSKVEAEKAIGAMKQC